MGGSNGELEDLTNRLVDRATAYGMKVSKEKRKDHDQQHKQHQKLEEVTSFKYLGATLCKNGTCSAEVRTRIA